MKEDINLLGSLLGDQAWLLTTVLSANESGIVITDHLAKDEPIIYCNEAFEKMTGYLREEVIGKNCRFLQGIDDEVNSRSQINAALEGGFNCNIKVLDYKKDGTPFINDLYIAPLRDKNGTVTHFIGVQNKITEESKVPFDSGEIKELSDGDELIAMSHELRTPLTALKGCLQLMSRIPATVDPIAKQKILLERSHAVLNRLSRAIENILQNKQ